jgi:hypothetical protein
MIVSIMTPSIDSDCNAQYNTFIGTLSAVKLSVVLQSVN